MRPEKEAEQQEPETHLSSPRAPVCKALGLRDNDRNRGLCRSGTPENETGVHTHGITGIKSTK